MNLLKPDPKFRNGYKDPKRISAIHNLPCVACTAKNLQQQTRTVVHHKIGMGLGKKASDLFTMALCEDHHNKSWQGIHNMPLHIWEDLFFTQDEGIEMTNKLLRNEDN